MTEAENDAETAADEETTAMTAAVASSEETAVDFDDILPHIGEMGRYQMGFYLLMCIPTIPAAFLAFNQVFLSAEPAHWCFVPDLADSGLNATQRRALSIPRKDLGSGLEDVIVYERCLQYDVNFTELKWRNGGEWPEEADRDWPKVTCQTGWEYDRSEYENTLVTEVRKKERKRSDSPFFFSFPGPKQRH